VSISLSGASDVRFHTEHLGSKAERVVVSRRTKKLIRGSLRRLGLDVARWKPQSSPEAALVRMLAQHGIDTVLDVGANEGQYALLLREFGFHGRIISFEPLTAAYQRLQRSAAKDPLWTIAPRMALGRQEGQIRVNVASDTVASSVLGMLVELERAAPDITYVGSEMVPIFRLDRVTREFLSEAQRVFLKVDVQGYEPEVLEGAKDILPMVAGVQLELSLVPLYEGQALYSSLVDVMQTQGFSIWGIVPGLVDNSSGRLLQTDVVFFRK
jgi:FkbM family methyltransferase